MAPFNLEKNIREKMENRELKNSKKSLCYAVCRLIVDVVCDYTLSILKWTEAL